MMGRLLLGATAAAMAVVANLTGSWGTAFWAAMLSALVAVATAVDALTRPYVESDTA